MNTILMMQASEQGANPLTAFLPMILIILVFYFLMIRPQVKRQKEMRQFRDSLAKGDKVVTTGGIYGKIVEIKDTAVILEVAPNVHIKVDKNGIIKDMSSAPQQQ